METPGEEKHLCIDERLTKVILNITRDAIALAGQHSLLYQ
tara:strand:+ start:3273 stop:3392 length:120 start_codon:yes stop_codon:yes gene_type:complete